MGKEVPSSTDAFNELKEYTDGYYAGRVAGADALAAARGLLSKHGIKFRQDDGKNPKVTISVPKTGNMLVVGVRYIKASGRNTEDHFLLRPNMNLYKCKGKELAKILPEYEGTHELQFVAEK